MDSVGTPLGVPKLQQLLLVLEGTCTAPVPMPWVMETFPGRLLGSMGTLKMTASGVPGCTPKGMLSSVTPEPVVNERTVTVPGVRIEANGEKSVVWLVTVMP